MRSESPKAIWKMAISNEAQSELKFFQKILRDKDNVSMQYLFKLSKKTIFIEISFLFLPNILYGSSINKMHLECMKKY